MEPAGVGLSCRAHARASVCIWEDWWEDCLACVSWAAPGRAEPWAWLGSLLGKERAPAASRAYARRASWGTLTASLPGASWGLGGSGIPHWLVMPCALLENGGPLLALGPRETHGTAHSSLGG